MICIKNNKTINLLFRKDCEFMKKILYLSLVLCILAAIVLVGCEKKEEEVGADIVVQDALQAIKDKAKEILGPDVSVPEPMPPEISDGTVTQDTCKNYTGLTPEQFEEYVLDAYAMPAAIMTIPFDLALVKCKDYASAKEVKKLIAEQFDPAERICAISPLCFVVESGRFVLLGGMTAEMAEAFHKAFDEQFETKTGEANTFFERGEDAGGGMGGGLILP